MTDQMDAAAAMWGLADYRGMAARLMPAARAVATAAGAGEGRRSLDVAAGTGNVAVVLRDAGWAVTATDLSPRMVQLGRARTGDTVRWDVAPVEHLPGADRCFALVTSSFGLIFSADPARAVSEVHRALEPGGSLLLTAWAPNGYIAAMTAVMSEHLPATNTPSPLAWGDARVVHERLSGFSQVEIEQRTLPWHFGSPAAARRFYETSSPAHAATIVHLGDRAPAMMNAVEQHLADLAAPDGAVRVDADYLLVSAVR